MMLDFDVVIVEDCCASLSREEHRDACETFLQCVLSRGILNFTRRQFGDVMTSGEVAEALEKGAQ